ncbi:MAG: hypothetical protein M1269_04255 [Chloroflexi bacterium]|nr:hypothetical protein [Chloroflexota bacterium]
MEQLNSMENMVKTDYPAPCGFPLSPLVSLLFPIGLGLILYGIFVSAGQGQDDESDKILEGIHEIRDTLKEIAAILKEKQ